MPLIDGLHGSKNMHGMVVDITSNAPLRRIIQHLELLTNAVTGHEGFEALRFTRMLTRDLYVLLSVISSANTEKGFPVAIIVYAVLCTHSTLRLHIHWACPHNDLLQYSIRPKLSRCSTYICSEP